MSSTEETLGPTRLSGLPTERANHGSTRGQSLSGGGEAPQIERGSALGRYLVVDRLGAGGMGVVYRAFDPDLDRSVALKLVGVGWNAGSESDQERSRLLREAQAMARLSHPNVIPVFDVGILDDAVFVAMELVDGVTLRQWQKAEERGWEQTLSVFIEAGRGLVAAHEAQLIHRDFKPDNVMIGRDSRVRVLDFGLARATGNEPSSTAELEDLRRSAEVDSLERSMTAAGAVMGTPAYMAPEQHLGMAAEAASDQFAFCVALFEALFGARPFTGDTMATLSLSVLQGTITMPAGRKSRAPGWVLAALQRGLAVDPKSRFPSMQALLDALSHDPARSRRRVWMGLGAVAVLGVGTALGATLGNEPEPTPPAPTLCTGAADAMAEVWSPARRDGIGQAFASSGVAFAEEAWSVTAPALDRMAETWIEEHTAACRATRVTAEQSVAVLDLRMACLDRQRDRLGSLATALETPSVDDIGRAFDAVRSLPDPAACGDLDALQQVTPPPSDPGRKNRLAQLRHEFDEVQTQLSLGHLEDARARLEPLLEPIETFDYPPLSSVVLDTYGILLEETADIKESRRVRQRAYVAATASGDAREAAFIAHGLAFAVGSRMSETDEGLHWVELGRGSVRRLGGDPRLSAMMDSDEGSIYTAAGRYEEALVAHERARQYWEQADPDAPELAGVLGDIGAVYVSLGRIDEAKAIHSRAIELREAAYGEHHPQVANAVRELGSALSQAHDYDAAQAQLERALEIGRASRGEDNHFVATVLDDLGRILRKKDQLEQAIEHHRKALQIWEAVLGDPHPDLAISILNIGYTLNAAGRFADALAEFERALKMFEATVGPEHPYIVYASNSVASAYVDLNRYAEAAPHIERVLKLDVKVDPTLIAESKFILTHALWAEGNAPAAARSRARRMAEEALAAYRGQPERWAGHIEKIEKWLAEHG
ncbi:MAG: serine/threonine-protein kinase [Myxococcota bacterium]